MTGEPRPELLPPPSPLPGTAMLSLSTPKWIALVAASLSFSPALPPHARKLNATLPRASLGDVKDFRLVPGAERVVYRADGDVDEIFALYSYAPDTHALVPLTSPHDFTAVSLASESDPSGRRVVFWRQSRRWSVPADGSAAPVQLSGLDRFSPDGEYMLFHLGGLNTSRRELYSQRADTSAWPIRLSGEFRPQNSVPDYAVTADSTRVVFLGNQRVSDRFEVFTVPIDGSAPFAALNARLGPNEDVTGFELAGGAALVVYRADQGQDETFELFAVPADGSAPSTRVTPPLAPGRDIGGEFRVTGDGAHVVFLADLDTPGVRELYGVALGGGPLAVKLSPPLAPGGSVLGALQLAPDGRAVVYRADPEGDGAVELFAARLDGGTPPQRLHDTLAPGRSLGRSEISADSSRALFLLQGEQVELLSAPLDGSAPAIPVHPPLVPDGDVVRFELAGARVVYRADQEMDEVLELFSAPLDATAPAVRLHPPLGPERAVLPDFRVSSDGRMVGFLADLREDERFEVFLSPSDGSAAPRLGSAPGTTARKPVGDVRAMAPAGAFAVYAADQERDEVVELYSVPRDGSRGPVRLHAPAVDEGDVEAFRVTPDGLRVVFSGDLEDDERNELWVALTDGSAPPVKLHAPLVAGGAVGAWRISPDGAWVAYAADALRDGQHELFRAPIDGSAPPVRLDPPPHRTFGSVGALELTPDGRSVVYLSDRSRRDRFDLYSVALDGSAPAVRLSAVTAPGGDVRDFRISADSTHVAYRADQDVDELPELYGVPLDAGTPPVKLNGPIAGNQRIWDYAIGARNRVVFTSGLAFLREIASVPIDASEPPRRFLSGLERSFDFRLTPGGTRVLFRTEYWRLQVYCAPIDASQPPVRIDGPIQRTKFFDPLFPDEDTVIYFAGTTGKPAGTYRTRLDGSTAPELVDATGAPRRLSPDGKLLMIHGSLGGIENDGLYVMPLDGSAPPRRLSQPLAPHGKVFASAFAAGGDVLYIASQDRSGPRELYASGAAFTPGRGGGLDGRASRER